MKNFVLKQNKVFTYIIQYYIDRKQNTGDYGLSTKVFKNKDKF